MSEEARCPCCNGLVSPTRLLVDLAGNRAERLGVTVHLTPTTTELLFILLRLYPDHARHDRLMLALYGSEGGAETAENTLKVHISKLRRMIAPLGVSIDPVWGTGYILVFGEGAVGRVLRGRNRRWQESELAELERLVFEEKLRVADAAAILKRPPGGAAHQVAVIAMKRQMAGSAHA